MCPNIKNSCCDTDTFKAMNVWWDGDGANSMNRLWLYKIRMIYKNLKEMKDIYYPKVMAYVKKLGQLREPNVQCQGLSEWITQVDEIKAFEQLFYVFPITAEKCWQFSIDFTRALACSVCDTSSTVYYNAGFFSLDPSQCRQFMTACGTHMKSFITFFTYVKWMSGIASCQTKNKVMYEEDTNYFDLEYLDSLNGCLRDPREYVCHAFCEKNMPWNGITAKELEIFSQMQSFLTNIKVAFPEKGKTEERDTIITTWIAPKDTELRSAFKRATFRPDNFKITDFYDPKNHGLTLDRLGFKDLREFMKNQESYSKFARNIFFSTIIMTVLLFSGFCLFMV